MLEIDFTNIDNLKVKFPKITEAVYTEDPAKLVARLRKAQMMLNYRTKNNLSADLARVTVALLNHRIDVVTRKG